LFETYVTVFVFLFGISIGSFLNVVILRLPKKQSLVSPPSHCPRCNYGLRWYDNVPILSYITLGGKCRKCRKPISIQYPLIELLTGVLALACYAHFDLTPAMFVYFIFCAILLTITFIDIPYQIIPNEISLPGILIGIGASFFIPELRWQDSLIGAIIGFLLIFLVAYGYWFLTKREGIGMGDAKLLALLGAFLGWQAIPFLLLGSSLQGLAVFFIGYAFGLIKKQPPLPDPDEEQESATNGEKEGEEELSVRHAAIPFGPFLALSGLEFLFFGKIILDFMTGWGF